MKKIITDIKKKFKKQHKYYILYISDEVISNASFSNEILKLNESFSIKLFIPKEYFYLRSDFHLNEFKSFFNFCDLTFCESRNHLSIFNFILYNINNEFELYCSESIGLSILGIDNSEILKKLNPYNIYTFNEKIDEYKNISVLDEEDTNNLIFELLNSFNFDTHVTK